MGPPAEAASAQRAAGAAPTPQANGRAAATDAPAPTRRWTYVPELDGLRALAMLAVVAFHYLPQVRGGYLGVTVFFVLSGYLITGLLATEFDNSRGVDYRAFYARRALRLYPALATVVVVAFVVSLIVGHRGVPGGDMALGAGASLIYVNDFVLAAGAHLTHWFDATWSLGVEEQFYLLWPVILVGLLRRMPAERLAGRLLGVAILIGLAYIPLGEVINQNWMGYSPIESVMPLLLGATLALRRTSVPRWLLWLAALVLAALVLKGPYYDSLWVSRGGRQLGSICAVIMIAGLIDGLGIMRGRVLVWLGRRSYGIYLIHMAVAQAILNLSPQIGEAGLCLIGIPLSVLLAGLSFRFIEQPFLRRKARFARASGEVRADVAVAR